MDVKNLTGLEKPLTKLVEVIAQGVGETTNSIFELDIKKIKRIGTAEAEVEKTKIIKRAEGQAEALSILNRAGKRFALEQYSKQVNLENILVKTKDELAGSNVSDEPVDKDWTFKFLNISQDISREDMQELLSKILAGEIKKPNSFSLRTLDFVKNLSVNDLKLFKKISPYLCADMYLFFTKRDANTGIFDITYGEIMNIMEIGFIQPTLSTVLTLGLKSNNKIVFSFKNGNYYFEFVNDVREADIPTLQLTNVAYELSSLFKTDENDKESFERYMTELKKYWESKNIKFVNMTKHDASI